MKSALRILAENLVFFLESDQSSSAKKKDLPKVDYWRTVAGRPVGFVGKIGRGVPITAGADLGASMRGIPDPMKAFRAEKRAATEYRAILNKNIDAADATPFGDAEYSDATKSAGAAMIERMQRLMPDNPLVAKLSKAIQLAESGKFKKRSQWVHHFTKLSDDRFDTSYLDSAHIKKVHEEYAKIFEAYFDDIKKENRERYGDPEIKFERDKDEATVSYGGLSVSVELKSLLATNGSQQRIAESVADFMLMNAKVIHGAISPEEARIRTAKDCRNFIDSDLATAARNQMKDFARADAKRRRDLLDSEKERWITNPDRPPARMGYWGIDDSPANPIRKAIGGRLGEKRDGDFFDSFEKLNNPSGNFLNKFSLYSFADTRQNYKDDINGLTENVGTIGVSEEELDEIFEKLGDLNAKLIDDVFDSMNWNLSKIEQKLGEISDDPALAGSWNAADFGNLSVASGAANGAAYIYDILRGADKKKHKPRLVSGGLESITRRNVSSNVRVKLGKYRNADGTINRSNCSTRYGKVEITLCNQEENLSFDPEKEKPVRFGVAGEGAVIENRTSRVLHHELGHWLDGAIPIQGTTGIRFLSAVKNEHEGELPSLIYRRAGEKKADFEMGLRDDLLCHYMGKIYESISDSDSEANSMAAEYMVGKVASTTALQDYRAFRHMVLLAEAKNLDYVKPKIDLSVDSKIIEKPKRGRPRKNP
jgi:hypothetical protein